MIPVPGRSHRQVRQVRNVVIDDNLVSTKIGACVTDNSRAPEHAYGRNLVFPVRETQIRNVRARAPALRSAFKLWSFVNADTFIDDWRRRRQRRSDDDALSVVSSVAVISGIRGDAERPDVLVP